ncbi:type II secretion system protein M (plasmid) [Rhodobacteraceae bacterium M382]|nr:type II secretion system protein M [Rhodobacteraceae bacterium M382]
MTQRFIDMLLRLSPRERALLGLLGAVVLPALIWMAVIAPLQTRHAAALQARSDIRALGSWVVGRTAEQVRLGGDMGGAAGSQRVPPLGISGLEQSLVAAGLRTAVSELGGQADGRIELRFDRVPFTDLAGWLSHSDPDWGYDITAFRLERGEEPGLVAVDLTLEPQG